MNDLTLQISAQRDDIYDWCCDRFKELMAVDDHDSALAIADEFYEWLDPEQMEDEITLFSNSDEVRALYEAMTSDQ